MMGKKGKKPGIVIVIGEGKPPRKPSKKAPKKGKKS